MTATLLLSVFSLLVHRLPCPPPQESAGPLAGEQGSLSAYLDEADLYVELFDLNLVGEQIGSSGLGWLCERFAPVLAQVGERFGEGKSAVILPIDAFGDAGSWREGARSLMKVLGGFLDLDETEAVQIADCLGPRISYAFIGGSRIEGSSGGSSGGSSDKAWSAEHGSHPNWSMAFALEKDATHPIGELLLPAIARVGAPAIEIVRMPAGEGLATAWELHGKEIGETFIVLRQDLMAWTSDADFAGHLRKAPPAAPHEAASLSPLRRQRREAQASGESVWGLVDCAKLIGREMKKSEQNRLYFETLGLERMSGVNFGFSRHGNQLASRLRVDRRSHAGIWSLLRGKPCGWVTLSALTADTLACAGTTRSIGDLVRDVLDLLQWVEPSQHQVASHVLEGLKGTPLAPWLEKDAFGQESLLFVRQGIPPQALLAVPVGEPVRKHLDEIYGAAMEASVGSKAWSVESGGLSLEFKPLESDGYWTAQADSFGFAFARVENLLVVSESGLSVKSYLRARSREQLSDREKVTASVRAGMASMVQGSDAGTPAAFAHARMHAIFSSYWPAALLGLNAIGLENVDDLPDAVELAEHIGDTNLMVFDSEKGLELRGRGLLAGLCIVF
jgi:hypothetical protein